MADTIQYMTDALHLKIEGLNTMVEALNIKIEALELKNLNYEYLLESYRSAGDISRHRNSNDGKTFRRVGENIAKLEEPLEKWLHKKLDKDNNFNRATYRSLMGILLSLFEHDKASGNLISEYMGGTRVTIVRHAKFLKKMGLVGYEGSRKKGAYILTEKGQQLRENLQQEAALS